MNFTFDERYDFYTNKIFSNKNKQYFLVPKKNMERCTNM